MENEKISRGQRKMMRFCANADNMRIVLAITHQARRWRLYAGFLGGATKPICSGETNRFTFMFEGAQFKLYLKGFFGTWEQPKPVPPYPGALEEDSAFESMIYATQVGERTGNTHVVYVDFRFAEALQMFLDELRELNYHMRLQAMAAALKAKEDGQIFSLFDDDEEELADGASTDGDQV